MRRIETKQECKKKKNRERRIKTKGQKNHKCMKHDQQYSTEYFLFVRYIFMGEKCYIRVLLEHLLLVSKKSQMLGLSM